MRRTALREAVRALAIAHDPLGGAAFLVRSRLPWLRASTVGRFRLGRLPFFARSGDWTAVREIVFEREYAFVDLALGQVVDPTVIDLGANVGLFSLYVLSRWPGARVFAVEPGREAFDLLERNRDANPGFDWRTHRCAVWESDGEVAFDERPESTASRVRPGASRTVPAVTLDSYFERHVRSRVDLLKVDVEGAEEAVLRGGQAALGEVENVVLELHPGLCDGPGVVARLRRTHPLVFRVPRRGSGKPLLLASRVPRPLPLYDEGSQA